MLDSVWLDEIVGALSLIALVLSPVLRWRGKKEDSVYVIWISIALALTLIAREW